ncbi:uncharacterized protein THITE_2119142 [Thermothielavioides terrestris NRRL 8126]|uniref:EH domain-containing protein n=1 Tax=Thermothielavioides terrestris (strain ATCC 38088 / NRRL 8126) TaxID=578455 RepID=G2RBE3_THETT|nr:uncharacterized protein THITE_2119142 [Thermothielavioides terrestris NRRL 8126]AEO69114.1 hypothetical protein THITE_2119142 [Thermothielavioides terrestris NRRL 8126]
MSTQLEPPAPPVRTSNHAKMAERIGQITVADPEGTQTDAPYKSEERMPTPERRRLSQSSASSDDTFVSASSVQSWAKSPTRAADKNPERPAQLSRRSSVWSLSTPDLPTRPARNASASNLTLDSLSNAIVASNLAAARLAVPTASQPPPVPAPRRPGRSSGSRSPLKPQRTADSVITRPELTGGSRSPTRPNQPAQRAGMLHTLRSPHAALSDDEGSRRHSHHHGHHHHRRRRSKALLLGSSNRMHAHHEGSRSRWRDAITPRERRRYEAVWASNRGLFLRPGWGRTLSDDEPEEEEEQLSRIAELGRAVDGPEAELVVNVVVRDIWTRSRLPADELAEVWDLVDRGARGTLAKEEFVVGMWLIDQRLKGRKIPARVSQSVWESAGAGVAGVVVPLPRGGKGR